MPQLSSIVENSKRVGSICQNEACGRYFIKFVSQASRCCSRACHLACNLETVPCCYPGCDATLKCRVFLKKTRGKSYVTYKTDLRRGGEYVRYPYCQTHSELINKRLGSNARAPNLRVYADPNYEYSARALNCDAIKMIVYEKTEGCCVGCNQPLDWNARKTWEIDHRVPIFKGGKTRLDNLNVCCIPCHKIKTSPEKSEAAKLRWAGRGRSERVHERNMTHYEKDCLIDELRAEIEKLRSINS